VTEGDLAVLAQKVEESVRQTGSSQIDTNEIGLAKPPRAALGQCRRGRSRIAFDHAVRRPARNERDLFVAQPTHAHEVPDTRLRLPRGHVTAPGGVHNLLRVRCDVGVSGEAEGR